MAPADSVLLVNKMNKCIVVSDSFKGTLSSTEICEIAKRVIPDYFPECELITIPMADGGEGTVDCLISALGAEPVTLTVSGPYTEDVDATYATYGGSAIIEMASCAGLALVGNKKNPALTTTYGVGEQILHAIKSGVSHIFLGLGGSATNDAGCGCAAALGVNFYNESGETFIPCGATLTNISRIDISEAKALFEGVGLTVMCDVENPMFGRNGAAYVFGPQKGADEDMIEMLDEGLVHLNSIMKKDLGIDMTNIKGAGAAGAMAAGMMAFLGGMIYPGIDAILTLTKFDKQLENADLVITGEGKLDAQSFNGKVISGIAKRTADKGIALYLIVGSSDIQDVDLSNYGVSAIFETNREHKPFEEIAPYALADYTETLEAALRYRKIQERKIL